MQKDCEVRSILGSDGQAWVQGGVAKVVIPATGGVVAMFFTDEHRSYWLRTAGH